jgi:perosamine synthetase
VDFFNTNISDKSIKLANEVFISKHVSAGKYAEEFENQLTRQLGVSSPLTVNSGTSALYLALAVAGIKPGDEVVLPPQTFIATGHVVLMHYAKPVFVDIQYKTGNIKPESFRQKITDKTKAVIPVHWGGYPCEMDEINEIAKARNIAVIEDAAHALGATYKGKPIGTVSRFTAFSFQAIKHVTTGDGGALCCLDQHDCYQAKRRRWFDIDRKNSVLSVLGEREYNAINIGYKFHMNDIAAAVGIGNLEEFSLHLKRRRNIASIYRSELKGVPGLHLLDYKDDRESSYWLFTVLVERRVDFMRKLKEHGVPSSVVHLRIDSNSVFGGVTPDLYNQEKFNDNQVSIPVHNDLTDEDIDLILNTIKKGW